MMKKIIAASIALAIMAAIVPAALAESSTVQPYTGPIGADSPLYSLKIFAQKVDVFLTFNDNDKMKKQMSYADERLSEAEAAFEDNDSGALEAALDEYDSALDDLNNTTQSPGINDSDYANLAPMLYHHGQCFYAMLNNSTNSTMTIEGRMMTAYNQTIKMKNGMPFYYYNGTAYFLPPGQANKIVNGSKVPPGLAKKGYVGPVPTITNGSITWPWDEMNYTYGNKTVPTTDKFNNGNGNGKDKNHNNGNGNGNGHGNGNNKK